MSSDQPYTPSEDDLVRAWKAYRDAADAADAWVREDDAEPAEDEARRFLARVRRDAGRAAMLAFVEEAERYRGLRDASDDRHSAQDVDGWWYVISAADEHIAEYHPDPEGETP